MDKLEEIKELLKRLSEDEIAEIKTFLASETGSETETEIESEAETPTKTETQEDAEPAPTESVESESTESELPGENDLIENTQEDPEPTESIETQDSAGEEEPAAELGESSAEVAEETPASDDGEDIPKMQRGLQVDDEEDEFNDPGIIDNTGAEMPVDYEQIVEGLNAKIAALEAENATLKNKVEGAFGYSSKMEIPTKTNRLYDDAIDVHFHK